MTDKTIEIPAIMDKYVCISLASFSVGKILLNKIFCDANAALIPTINKIIIAKNKNIENKILNIVIFLKFYF